jgi:hypothetical protein
MKMICVKNDVVKMDWDVNGFIDNRYLGFIGAAHDYHGIVVMFEEDQVYTMVGDDGPLDMKTIVKAVMDSYNIKKGKEANAFREYDMDEYNEFLLLVSGEDTMDENIKHVGLTDADMEDIMLRIQDLAPYYAEIIEDM